jgi:hypothetical protein
MQTVLKGQRLAWPSRQGLFRSRGSAERRSCKAEPAEFPDVTEQRGTNVSFSA